MSEKQKGPSTAPTIDGRTSGTIHATTNSSTEFAAYMRSLGLNSPGHIPPSKWVRFPGVGKGNGNTAGWAYMFPDGNGGVFGDWSTGLSETWQARRTTPYTKAEHDEFNRQVAEVTAQAEKERKVRQTGAAARAQAIWGAAPPAPNDHSYLVRKGITANGTRLHNGDLVIPVCEGEAINSLQFISPNGDKLFLTGGRVKGLYSLIGSMDGASSLCICEGFATGASIHEATDYPVVVTFNAGNLQSVALAMREKYPDVTIIVCADDDYRTDGNPGVTKAREAARAVNGQLAIPHFGDNRPDGMTDFNDMAKHLGLSAVEERVRNAQPVVVETSVAEWQAPVLFEEIETPDIPASLLPDVCGEFASALAEETETPEALSVMTVLGILSVCGSKRFTVSPRQGWQEPVNIYVITGLPPANNKSLVLKRCTKPLHDWERKQEEFLAPEIAREQSERKTREKIIEKLRAKAAQATGAEQSDLITEIADKEAALLELPSRYLPKLFATDITPEALGLSLQEQNGRFAILTDEGGILEVVAGLYSNGAANIDLILKGIDGGATRIRRMGRYIGLNPYLTLLIVAQPAIIQGMGGKRAFLGNGTTERFLYAIPKSKLGYRTHSTKPVPQDIANAFNQRITDLLNIQALAENGVERPYVLTLASDALSDWREFQSAVEKELRPNGRMAPCLGWGGKISGYALRIAGLLHIAEHGHYGLTISKETMEKALEISTLLIDHAIVAFSFMGIDQATSDAKEIAQWVMANGRPEFTQRDLTYAMRNRKMGTPERIHLAVEILIERHILTAERLPTKKPTTLYRVNPALLRGDYGLAG